jgi:hypothetical protein
MDNKLNHGGNPLIDGAADALWALTGRHCAGGRLGIRASDMRGILLIRCATFSATDNDPLLYTALKSAQDHQVLAGMWLVADDAAKSMRFVPANEVAEALSDT